MYSYAEYKNYKLRAIIRMVTLDMENRVIEQIDELELRRN